MRSIQLNGGPGWVNVGGLERMASAASGALLAAYGTRRGSGWGLTLAAAGGVLILRGLSGYCPINDAIGRNSAQGVSAGLDIRTSLTVNRPRIEVYQYWRRLENLPRFMKHVSEVREITATRSRWVVAIPKTERRIEWDAVLEADEEGRRLAWRSVHESAVENAGEVRLEDAPGGRGTEMHVHITYRPHAGTAASRLLNPVFEQMVKEDVRRFKHVFEAGEVPATTGQPSG